MNLVISDVVNGEQEHVKQQMEDVYVELDGLDLVLFMFNMVDTKEKLLQIIVYWRVTTVTDTNQTNVDKSIICFSWYIKIDMVML